MQTISIKSLHDSGSGLIGSSYVRDCRPSRATNSLCSCAALILGRVSKMNFREGNATMPSRFESNEWTPVYLFVRISN